MNLKDDVSLVGLGEAMATAAQIVERCYADEGRECWITSGTERHTKHHGQPVVGDTEDPHYTGKALDFRIWHVPLERRATLVANIRDALGDEYVVLWERRGTATEHLHCQHGHIAA